MNELHKQRKRFINKEKVHVIGKELSYNIETVIVP